jgi:hypothetical protein
LYDEIKSEYNPKEEFEFEEQAKLFIGSFKAMQKKYQHLLIKQSQVSDEILVGKPSSILLLQLQAPTSELMMLDRLRVADLKDEIVSMQTELNSVLFEQHQKTQMTIKTEAPPVLDPFNQGHIQPMISPRQHQTAPIMQEPSQILKAKQEQKLFESIKNERVKIEVSAIPPLSPSQKSPNTSQKQSKFDKLKSESINMNQMKKPEMKEEIDDFDIESEIRPNLIMKKCEVAPLVAAPQPQIAKKTPRQRQEKEREFSPMSDYFNKKVTVPVKPKEQDGSYDEWLSIQKELNLQLTSSSKKKETKEKHNDLSEIFEPHASPKSVEKQLDDLFSSANKSNDLLTANSPLTEFFNVEAANLNEKTVENRLEALFGGEEDSRKSTQQDLVETRLEQLFQGSVAENDESALDNASFLYKSNDMTYEMIQKQIQVGENSSTSNKRQWNGDCDMFSSSNASMMFPSSSPSSKRACTAAPVSSVSFDNKWIEDSFDFATEIMSTESSGDDITKHRSWNGNIDHPIGGIQSPHQNQFHDVQPNMQQQMNLMDAQMPNLQYDDVDDISRQVQNAIDSILNLQSSDPLTYQLDSSFLELNTITAPSGAPNSPMNIQQHPHQPANQPHMNQYQMHHQMNHGFNNQKPSGLPKRKYSRMDDIGDCLIGGSNLDDSPSALAISEAHGGESSSASVGEFVNNLLNCEEKSITTS